MDPSQAAARLDLAINWLQHQIRISKLEPMLTNTLYRNRRLILMIVLVLLGFGAGFVWGREYGYNQGKADTMKMIERNSVRLQWGELLMYRAT